MDVNMNKTELTDITRDDFEEAACSAVPVVIALFAAIACIAYIVYRTVDTHLYRKKWSDYDECGL